MCILFFGFARIIFIYISRSYFNKHESQYYSEAFITCSGEFNIENNEVGKTKYKMQTYL